MKRKSILVLTIMILMSTRSVYASKTNVKLKLNEGSSIVNTNNAIRISGKGTPGATVKSLQKNSKIKENGTFVIRINLKQEHPKKIKVSASKKGFQTTIKKIKIKSNTNIDYSKLKLSMSTKQVMSKIGVPDFITGDTYAYGKDNLFFSNEHKLLSGTPKAIIDMNASSSSAKKEVSKNQTTKQHKQSNQQEHIKSFARTFGNKPAQEIQRKSYAYSSNNIDGMGMVYMWKNDFGILMRVDSSDNITSVYLYDANAEQRKGELLYQGHTIINEQKKQYNFYN